MSNFSITPNPSKLIESLRYLTYTNETAVADIVDNSLDAEAQNVNIIINKDEHIIILDDGFGMDDIVLEEAVRLGSDTDKEQTELGRFGMGLVTASISMGRRIEVISKIEDGTPLKVVLDLDYIKENGWEALHEPLTEEEEKYFANIEHGTSVKICKLDSVKPNIGKSVAYHLRRVFRNFLNAGRTITVNGEELKPIDPLARDISDTVIMLEKEIELDGEPINIVVAHLNASKSDMSAQYDDEDHVGISMSKQGFYTVRNNREIAEADTYGLFPKHPSKNRFRCEVSYTGDLDKQFGINFTKNRVDPNQALKDKIKAEVMPLLNLVAKQADEETKVKNSEKIDHSDAEDIIRRKKSLLDLQNTWKEKRKSPKHRKTKEEEDKDDDDKQKQHRKRVNIKNIQPGKREMPVEFREGRHGDLAPLFNSYVEGNRVIVEWNICHPFHSKIIARYSGNKNILSPVDLLVYSLAKERLFLEDGSPEQEVINATIDNMSKSLRILMQ